MRKNREAHFFRCPPERRLEVAETEELLFKLWTWSMMYYSLTLGFCINIPVDVN